MIRSARWDIDMKRIFPFFLAFLIFFSGCSKKSDGMERISGSEFYSRQNGKKYTLCSASLAPKSIADEFSQTDDGLIFYKLAGAVPSEFIATGDESFRKVFVSESAKEPRLEDFTEPDVFICAITESGYISANTILKDKKIIKAIPDALSREKISLPYGNQLAKIIPIRFESEKIPAFYYYLYVYSTIDGKCILYDEGQDNSVDATDIFGEIL